MCGLAAILRLDGAPADAALVGRMTKVLAHRGPDDSGLFVSGPIGMGFRRLSILDLSPAGHQPMVTREGQVVLVFNGEIYNYLELREDLIKLGHDFLSRGDTEVLLRAYLQWGVRCVERLNGMWAFVIWDRSRGTVFGSRDRFGIKPLYRYRNSECLILASEIKAIRASGVYRGGVDWGRASRFLLDGEIDETVHTFHAGIEQVPPGTAFEVDLRGNAHEWRYWSLDDVSRIDGYKADQRFAELFDDAVRLHMRSDVPVGVHLSGGLDSTSILCASARIRSDHRASRPLMAFSYLAPEFDETRYVEDTIAATAATLVRLDTSPLRLWEILKEVLWFQDEPIYSMMPLVSYELMRLTAQHGVKVILNGQGADETLAGYPSYFGEYWYTILGGGRVGDAWREIGAYTQVHGGSRLRHFATQVERLARSPLRRFASYRRAAAARRFRARIGARSWFTEELRRALPRDDAEAPPGLDPALIHSIYRTPLPRILRVEDRNSMAHSIESRLPFLDYRLVEFAFGLPPEWRMRGPWNKYVLRESMRERIPESVRARPDKMGFPVPANDWIAGPLRGPILDVLTSRAARERGIYRTDNIIRDIERHARGEIRVGSEIFDVAQFEMWMLQ
jgi:asparagine synthase (glutamine-hydrolysing)